MSKINEALVMMAEQKETFEVNGKKFQVIEVKDAEEQPDYSHLVGKWVKCLQRSYGNTKGEWYEVQDVCGIIIEIKTDNPSQTTSWGINSGLVQDFFDLSNPSDTKQETLEEAAYQDCKKSGLNNTSYAAQGIYSFIEGAKWQQERMYSEEKVYDLFAQWNAYQQGFPRLDEDEIPNGFMSFNEWYEQFKKK